LNYKRILILLKEEKTERISNCEIFYKKRRRIC